METLNHIFLKFLGTLMWQNQFLFVPHGAGKVDGSRLFLVCVSCVAVERTVNRFVKASFFVIYVKAMANKLEESETLASPLRHCQVHIGGSTEIWTQCIAGFRVQSTN